MIRHHTVLIGALLSSALKISAQGYAPQSLPGSSFSVTALTATAPFSTSGFYRLFTSPLGSNFVVVGNAATGLNAGTYSYAKTGANSATISFVDSQSGAGFSGQFTFASGNAGALYLSNGLAGQTNFFALTNFGNTNIPTLDVPGVSNQLFQAWLGGQVGYVYQVQTSSNLLTWNSLTNITLPDRVTNLSESTSNKNRFYRASLLGTSFAPGSMLNKTLNLTITDGVDPLPVDGICQWMGATNGNNYSVTGGIGVTNSTGTYSYTKSVGDSAILVSSDSIYGTVTNRLYFTSPGGGYFYGASSAGYDSGSFTIADGPVEFLGNIAVTTDTDRSGTLYFAANGKSASLSVTNVDGWVWTLSLPKNALLSPQYITMIPSSGVDSGNCMLNVSSSVMLEPDGLQFAAPATLTLQTPAPLGPHAALVMGGDDGSAIYFVRTTGLSNTYSTTLAHFTSAGAVDLTDGELNDFNSAHLQAANAAFDQALNDVKALSRVVRIPPVPPDYSLSCDPNANPGQLDAINAYEKAIFAKQRDAAQRLLGAAFELYELTGQDGSIQIANSAIHNLMQTDGERVVNSLFSRYFGDPKKFKVCFDLALIVTAEELTDASNFGPGLWDTKMEQWSYKIRDYYLNQLKTQHDYSLVQVLIALYQQLEGLYGTGNYTHLLDPISSALTFNLHLDFKLSGGAGQSEASSDIVLYTDLESGKDPAGSGVVNYISGSFAGATLVPGQSFSEDIDTPKFDVCQSFIADVTLSKVGPATESYQESGLSYSVQSLLRQSCESVFGSKKASNGLYTFPCHIHNKNVQTIDETFTGSGGGGAVTLKIKATHTPH